MKIYLNHTGKVIRSNLYNSIYAIKDNSNYIVSETGYILITESGKKIIKEQNQ